jgi:hypothetical protein
LFRRERSSQPDATGSYLPKKPHDSPAGSQQPTPRSSRAKPALVDFVMAEFDRFANRTRLEPKLALAA